MKKANLAVLFSKESFITGSTLTFGTFATLYWAEQYVASGVGAVLSATGPIMILLIQTMVLHVKLSIRTFVGSAISLIGVALLLMPNLTVSYDSIWLIACFLILLGQVGYAKRNDLFQKGVRAFFRHLTYYAECYSNDLRRCIASLAVFDI